MNSEEPCSFSPPRLIVDPMRLTTSFKRFFGYFEDWTDERTLMTFESADSEASELALSISVKLL